LFLVRLSDANLEESTKAISETAASTVDSNTTQTEVHAVISNENKISIRQNSVVKFTLGIHSVSRLLTSHSVAVFDRKTLNRRLSWKWIKCNLEQYVKITG